MSQHQTRALLLIFLGGGIGAVLRHTVNQASAALLGLHFPWGTLFVNVFGSFVMGLLAGWFAFRSDESSQLYRLFLTTGVLGGFTTFSAFSLDAAVLWDRGQISIAAAYVLGSVMAAILGVFGGLRIIRLLFPSV